VLSGLVVVAGPATFLENLEVCLHVQHDVTATIRIVSAFGQAIRDLGSVPSGHLYATVMGSLNLTEYQAAIGILIKAGLVEDRHHLLVWIGRKPE
jgi:hypothetical protein